MKRSREALMAFVVCAAVLASPLSARAAKVELEKPNGRLLPAMIYLVGTYDEQGRPDASVIDRAGIAETPTKQKMIFYVAVSPARQTAKNIESSGAFTVNVPNRALLAQMDYCGRVSAISGDLYIDKFATTGLRHEKASDVNAPILTDCPVVFECKLVKTKDFVNGSHRVYMGEVVSYHVSSAVLDGDGAKPVEQFSPAKADSILYFPGGGARSGYWSVGAPRGHRGDHYPLKFPCPNGLEPKPKGH